MTSGHETSTPVAKATPVVTKRTMKQFERNREKPVQRQRLAVQVAFALICIWIGVEFHQFANFLETGGDAAFTARPPGSEAFIPISSLMSLYYFFLTGEIHPSHPAGFFILLGIVIVSFLFGKSLCSYICPVGLLSEKLGDLSEKIFKRKMKLPRFLDYPLRSIKYLLLVFFVYAIFIMMNAASLKLFLDSPYNIVCDVKMYYFFAHISKVALIVIGALFLLSFFIRNFWCRYLCPYGALTGILSLLSPTRIKRNATTCIDCGKCAKVCPSNISVDRVKTVYSDECTTCLKCVDACPVADTLALEAQGTRKRIPKKWIVAGVVGIYGSIVGFAMVTGLWQNSVSAEEYLYHQQHLEEYGHPRSTDDVDALNRAAEADRNDH